MDRLFLDANVLFSAAYRPGAGLLGIWKLKDVVLCSSWYPLEEARTNLDEDFQRTALNKLARALDFFDGTSGSLPREISLPEKDVPILLAAIEVQCTHLLTGDIRHFSRYLGKKIEGILVVSPGTYLKNRNRSRG